MIYVEENETIKKYKIEVDHEKLYALKLRIINECSLVSHVTLKRRADYLPKQNHEHMKNYYERKVGKTENRDFFGPLYYDLYEVSYDWYEKTKYIELIENAKCGGPKAVFELLEYVPPKKKTIEELSLELSKLDPNSNEMREKLEEIETRVKNAHLNKDKKEEIEFMNDVIGCISIILVDEIDKETYKNVSKFTDSSPVPIIKDEEIKRLIYGKVSV
jgi:hypothetical protein